MFYLLVSLTINILTMVAALAEMCQFPLILHISIIKIKKCTFPITLHFLSSDYGAADCFDSVQCAHLLKASIASSH